MIYKLWQLSVLSDRERERDFYWRNKVFLLDLVDPEKSSTSIKSEEPEPLFVKVLTPLHPGNNR